MEEESILKKEKIIIGLIHFFFSIWYQKKIFKSLIINTI
jgi:hypothetical protein